MTGYVIGNPALTQASLFGESTLAASRPAGIQNCLFYLFLIHIFCLIVDIYINKIHPFPKESIFFFKNIGFCLEKTLYSVIISLNSVRRLKIDCLKENEDPAEYQAN